MVILGGTRWDAESVRQFQDFAKTWNLPVGCSFRRQMLFDNLHPSYAGDVGIGINPALAERVRAADLLLAVGPRRLHGVVDTQHAIDHGKLAVRAQVNESHVAF